MSNSRRPARHKRYSGEEEEKIGVPVTIRTNRLVSMRTLQHGHRLAPPLDNEALTPVPDAGQQVTRLAVKIHSRNHCGHQNLLKYTIV